MLLVPSPTSVESATESPVAISLLTVRSVKAPVLSTKTSPRMFRSPSTSTVSAPPVVWTWTSLPAAVAWMVVESAPVPV